MRAFGLLVSLAVLLGVAPAAFAAVPAECSGVSVVPRPAYYYETGKEPVSLSTPREHAQLLVRCVAGSRDTRSPREVLAAAGFEVREVHDVSGTADKATTGLFLADLAKPLDSRTLDQHLAALARDGGCLDVASTLYLSEDRAKVVALAPIYALPQPGVKAQAYIDAAAALGLAHTGFDGGDPAVLAFEPDQPFVDLWCLSRKLYETGVFQWVEPEMFFRLRALTNDPFYVNQWGIDNTGQTVCGAAGLAEADANVDQAWSLATGAGMRIAVIDDGIQLNHPDLPVVAAHDTWDNDGDGGPIVSFDRHGTSCAGIAAATAENSQGVAGVAPSAGMVAVRFAEAGSGGSLDTSNGAMKRAIDWAWDNENADVLSNSWGGGSPSNRVKRAIRRAKDDGRGGLGSVVLFATGNDDANNVIWPAEMDEVIAVGASSPCDERKNPGSCDGETNWGSNFGPEVDIVAPGVAMHTTDRTGSAGYNNAGDFFACFNGTSSATPFAAGVAALLLSRNPALTADRVQEILQLSAQDIEAPGFDNASGHGRVDALRTLEFAFCSPSGDEKAGFYWASGNRYRVYSFVPGEIFVATPHVLLKIQNVGGTGQNMFALETSGGIHSVAGYPYLLGSQVFNGVINDVDYIAGQTLVSLSDGRLLKVHGTGGTGQNMFAVSEHSAGFTGLSGYPYYAGSHRFDSGVRSVTAIGGQTLIAFADGKLLKVNGSCGGGFNLCAINETSSDFTGLSGYSYYAGDQDVSAAASVVAVVGGQTLIGFENGKMLKINGSGGGGHNMFAVTETSGGFNGLSGYTYYAGDADFSSAARVITGTSGYTLIGFDNGKLLKINGTGGGGHNMFAVNETSGGFDGLAGYSYYVGDQAFGGGVRVIEDVGGSTLVGLADGRMLRSSGTGGGGHNLFAVNPTSYGFETVTGYSYLQGSAHFNRPVVSFTQIGGVSFFGLADGAFVKVQGTGGTGGNMMALVREGGCFQGLCGYDYFRGCQDFSGSPF
ncbi:MAG TPA: S8 family serine peptidase [Thermoanaerobaculia bacterium]|nr:S8 family serine peptidase [Thermoanaerobaculia bacterium]